MLSVVTVVVLHLRNLQQHPRFPFFPYTTLFRSHVCPDAGAQGGASPSRGREEDGNNNERTDRKSTRVNSSHPSISYAVFCLKKKKRYARYARLSLGGDDVFMIKVLEVRIVS